MITLFDFCFSQRPNFLEIRVVQLEPMSFLKFHNKDEVTLASPEEHKSSDDAYLTATHFITNVANFTQVR